MAVDCTGPIIGETVDAVESTGQNCLIRDSVILGDVTITDSPVTHMWSNRVGGRVQIVGGGRASVILNVLESVDNALFHTFNAADLRIVAGNIVAGSLTVNNNLGALVEENVVGGNLTCTGNAELDSGTNDVGGVSNCVDDADL
jgi:hypothetical protein